MEPQYKIIHQTWKSEKTLPLQFQEWSQTWKSNHPQWKYQFWDDYALDGFVQHNHSQLWSLYAGLKQRIQQVDVARYLILETYGGLYVDMDFECRQPVDSLLFNVNHAVETPTAAICYDNMFCQEPTQHAQTVYKRSSIISNAIMYTEPSHPIWYLVKERLKQTCRRYKQDVLRSTGPAVLDFCVRQCQLKMPMNILPPIVFFSKLAPGYKKPNFEKQSSSDKIFGIHHWANSWTTSPNIVLGQVNSTDNKFTLL